MHCARSPKDSHNDCNLLRETTVRRSGRSGQQDTMDEHAERVRKIAAAVKGFHETKQKFRIDHGSTNSTRNQRSKGNNVINTSKMNHVLTVDTDKRTILVEPNVPMDRLVEATLAHDLIPLVIMDFPGVRIVRQALYMSLRIGVVLTFVRLPQVEAMPVQRARAALSSMASSATPSTLSRWC